MVLLASFLFLSFWRGCTVAHASCDNDDSNPLVGLGPVKRCEPNVTNPTSRRPTQTQHSANPPLCNWPVPNLLNHDTTASTATPDCYHLVLTIQSLTKQKGKSQQKKPTKPNPYIKFGTTRRVIVFYRPIFPSYSPLILTHRLPHTPSRAGRKKNQNQSNNERA
jgi:hypothetical protein